MVNTTSGGLIEVLHLCVSLLLVWIVAECWRTYRLDALRQKLFALRDDLFDVADGGLTQFDDPAYRILRGRINSIIRFAHEITLTQLLFLSLAAKRMQPPDRGGWEIALNGLADKEARKRLNDIHEEAQRLLKEHLVNSPLPPLGYVLLRLLTLMASALTKLIVALDPRSSLTIPSPTYRLSRNLPVDLLEAQALETDATEQTQMRFPIRARAH
jgi:hypothetical protein